jgi:hypothetical protein
MLHSPDLSMLCFVSHSVQIRRYVIHIPEHASVRRCRRWNTMIHASRCVIPRFASDVLVRSTDVLQMEILALDGD